MSKEIRPYGLWPSPITPHSVALKTLRFSLVRCVGDSIYWSESRPDEKGRSVIMRANRSGEIEDILPAPFSARSRVHEYGGGEFLPTENEVFFVNDEDQDVYRLAVGNQPERLTDYPLMRFADFAFDKGRRRLVAVAERHHDDIDHARPENLLVSIDLKKPPKSSVSDLVTGRDFFASPCLNAQGSQLAWMAWDLPDMPWDQAALYVADILPGGMLSSAKLIAGGEGSAVFQPEWSADGALYYVSDQTGWGNLYRFEDGDNKRVTDLEAELNRPLWVFGMRSYALLPSGDIVLSLFDRGENKLALLTPESGKIKEYRTDLTSVEQLNESGGDIAAIATAGHFASTIVRIDCNSGTVTALRHSSENSIGKENISVAKMLTFRNETGAPVHGQYYGPQNGLYEGPFGDKPPAVLLVHGGPTGLSDRGLKLKTQFWTSRGFAVFDIDYSGSTGYGRAYRNRLDGLWGVRDVSDILEGAGFLIDQGLADKRKLFISGGSAGGFTILMALANSRIFAGAACYYGVSDLEQLLKITHKFEAGYLYRLLGCNPAEVSPVFKERSPLSHAGKISTPVIFFQGLDDKVVPPEQSRTIVAALKDNGLKVRYLEFEGEGHGFRRSENLITALENEYEFFADIIQENGL